MLASLAIAWSLTGRRAEMEQHQQSRAPQGAESSRANAEPVNLVLVDPEAQSSRHNSVKVALTGASSEVAPPPNSVQLRAGIATRESVGAAYDSLIRELARGDCLANVEVQLEGRAADFCGFDNWQQIEQFIETAKPEQADLVPLLRDLSAKALEVSASANECYARAWGEGRHVEVWDPNSDHDRDAWRSDNGYNDRRGALRSSTTTSVGDRVFSLHFDSHFFPQLDVAVREIQAEREAFWEIVGGK